MNTPSNASSDHEVPTAMAASAPESTDFGSADSGSTDSDKDNAPVDSPDSPASVRKKAAPRQSKSGVNLLKPIDSSATLSGVGEDVGRVARGLNRRTRSVLRQAGMFTLGTMRIPKAFLPLAQMLAHNQAITEDQLSLVLDDLFQSLYDHPLTRSTQKLTDYLRTRDLLPNESSTEDLIRFIVNQCVARSPVPVPDIVIDEFWAFFEELLDAPELKGMMELNLDIVRYVLRTYEPLMVELANLLKETRRLNESKLNELAFRAKVVSEDLVIIRRQIKALRHIKPFFQTDPQDFATQAQIVADMVREFGPFFVKMAQAAASNSDFLPDEIAKELQVFHEDVPPMSAAEVHEAFQQSFGCAPSDMYYGFDANKPLQSGSIGCVFLARRPFTEGDSEVLRPVIVKVGRHNLDREFLMGKTVIGLAIISTQYWAPHSRLAPFLQAMQEQVDEFVKGFQEELDFVDEARIQRRFQRRSQTSTVWEVPRIYRASSRVLEMEYLEDAAGIGKAVEGLPVKQRDRFKRKVARKLLYTMLEHILVFREFHGDLHPGNIMVSPDADLYLIDWGNVVRLEGKWQELWSYSLGVLTGDAELIADTLIRVSTNPKRNRLRRQEIIDTLDETLMRKNIAKLQGNWPRILASEGVEGLHNRLQTVMQLMSNTQQMGLVVRSEYLHLSRSLFSAVGSYSSLYSDGPLYRMLAEFLRGLAAFPIDYAADKARLKAENVRRSVGNVLPG